MVDISLMIEGQNGLTWTKWQKLVAEAEHLGFAGLFRSDHFINSQTPDRDSLEMIVSLTYLADRTQRMHFGPLVAPVSFREPVLLARQAAAIDDLSHGRMILGVGAGWQDREHDTFGYDLGDVPTRMHRLEEALKVITHLYQSDEPVTYEGRFFQLREAILLPRPQRQGGPPILIGGNGPKRTLPLAARYADIWNAVLILPATFRELSTQLDTLLIAEGRQPKDVRRTAMLGMAFGQHAEELERRLGPLRTDPELMTLSLEQAIEKITASQPMLVGNAEQIVAQIQTYAQAGVEEVMVQWTDYDDIDGLRAFAAGVLPQL